MATIPREEGRTAFGDDPAGYARGRPAYPVRVWDVLRALDAPWPDAEVFEIGAGTGLATRALLDLGVRRLTAAEPDRRLAAYLARDLEAAGGGRLTVMTAPFEAAALEEATYDLGVAATSFHWLEAGPALAKVKRLLKPGGCWAMWATVFTDPRAADPFRDATDHLFADLEQTPGFGDGRLPYALDAEARLAELAEAGFAALDHELIAETRTMDAATMTALYATFSQVARLGDLARQRFFDGLHEVIETRFGGVVQRRFVTAIYTARKPRA